RAEEWRVGIRRHNVGRVALDDVDERLTVRGGVDRLGPFRRPAFKYTSSALRAFSAHFSPAPIDCKGRPPTLRGDWASAMRAQYSEMLEVWDAVHWLGDDSLRRRRLEWGKGARGE